MKRVPHLWTCCVAFLLILLWQTTRPRAPTLAEVLSQRDLAAQEESATNLREIANVSSLRPFGDVRAQDSGEETSSSSCLQYALFSSWTKEYGVEAGAGRTLSASAVHGQEAAVLEASCPRSPLSVPAPHLIACVGLTRRRIHSEERGPDGRPPAWVSPQGPHGSGPAGLSRQRQAVAAAMRGSEARSKGLGQNHDRALQSLEQANVSPPVGTESGASDGPAQHGPLPPWIRGLDAENLPQTRQAQADIWLHQFPEHRCSSPGTRLLLVVWDSCEFHGMGAQLHFMTHMLGLAMLHDRILVPLPGTYCRAGHDGCGGPHKKSRGHGRLDEPPGVSSGSRRSSFSCYFLPPVSAECEAKASEFLPCSRAAEKMRSRAGAPAAAGMNQTVCAVGGEDISFAEFTKHSKYRPFLEALSSPTAMVKASLLLSGKCKDKTAAVPPMWGQPWLKSDPHEVLGELPSPADVDTRLKINWWRAQGVRFLLRWPSEYLCHILNFARHQTYGWDVARLLARPLAQQSTQGEPQLSQGAAHAQLAHAALTQSRVSPRGLSRVADADSRTPWVQGELAGTQEELDPRPFLPRPMVRVHVRGSDLRAEAAIHPFSDYFKVAQKLRLALMQSAEPGTLGMAQPGIGARSSGVGKMASFALWGNATGVWLSSEEEAAMAQARDLIEQSGGTWKLFALEMEHKWKDSLMGDVLHGTDRALRRGQWEYALRFGLRDVVEASLANLLVSVDSDAFVLALSSNFNRLANELRLTGGRLKAPVAVLGESREW